MASPWNIMSFTSGPKLAKWKASESDELALSSSSKKEVRMAKKGEGVLFREEKGF
ncbi:DNA gyrase subunit A [Sesbania bispinosa]|nr:DNA gyrase subunit A [Sesbania bispinosa]